VCAGLLFTPSDASAVAGVTSFDAHRREPREQGMAGHVSNDHWPACLQHASGALADPARRLSHRARVSAMERSLSAIMFAPFLPSRVQRLMPPAGRRLLHSWRVGLALGMKRFTGRIPTAKRRRQAAPVPAARGQIRRRFASLPDHEAAERRFWWTKRSPSDRHVSVAVARCPGDRNNDAARGSPQFSRNLQACPDERAIMLHLVGHDNAERQT
jgi:hypothetical protein